MSDKTLNEWIELFETASEAGNLIQLIYDYTDQIEKEAYQKGYNEGANAAAREMQSKL